MSVRNSYFSPNIWLNLRRYLYITGRSKEIINKGGEVISPSQVEEAIIAAANGLVKVRSSHLCLFYFVVYFV